MTKPEDWNMEGNIFDDLREMEKIAKERARLKSAARGAAKQGKGKYGLCDACKFRAGNVCWTPATKMKITERIEECVLFDI